MDEIFGVKNDIDSVIDMTRGFLTELRYIKEKNKKAVLNPNYIALLDKLFKSPDIMMFRK